jgi:hypothetical protein
MTNRDVLYGDPTTTDARPAAAPVMLADAGAEIVNARVDDLITTAVLRRGLAFTELKFSNSVIEASRRDWLREARPHCSLA